MAEEKKAVIDVSICTSCGVCIDACPKHVLEEVHDLAKISKTDICDGCGACVEICPIGAVKLQ